MILWIYGTVLLWQVVWLIMAIRNRKGWARLLILEAVSVAAALGTMWYFDTLPGVGIMPGWAYFAEVFYSLVAAVVYGFLCAVTALLALIRKK